jgi:hypothetical protein
MTGIYVRGNVVLLVGVLFGTQAIGQSPSAAPARSSEKEEMICEKVEVLGSRLQTKRVCMTRSQWAERRLEDRMDLEKRQIRGYKFE